MTNNYVSQLLHLTNTFKTFISSRFIPSHSSSFSEMSRQREAFKEEVRGLKNDMKTAENKHEVIQKKLLSAREQIGTLEREVRCPVRGQVFGQLVVKNKS